MEEKVIEEIQNNFNESTMEELIGDSIVENNVNEENIGGEEDGN